MSDARPHLRGAAPVTGRFAAIAPWAALAALLALTVAAWRATEIYTHARVAERFQLEVKQIAEDLEQRVSDYELTLRAVAGLFHVAAPVQLKQWRLFIDSLALHQLFPGAHGVGYAPLVKHDDLAAFIAAVRADGQPQYEVRPPGDRPLYAPIRYVRVRGDQNPPGLGYDMYAEPVRRAAMEAARDTGAPAISGLVLQPPDGANPRRGVLIYFPIYSAGAPTDSAEARRNAIEGFAFTPLPLDNLIKGVVSKRQGGIHISLKDENARAEDSSLVEFHHLSDRDSLDQPPRHAVILPMQISERTWLLEATTDSTYATPAEVYLPPLIAVGGCIISILLFIAVHNLTSRRRQAEELALEMTKELKRKNRDLEQFANIMAHHLQEPVRLIYIFCQRLHKLIGGAGDPEVRQCVETIQAAAGRERTLLRDIQLYLAVGQEDSGISSSPQQAAEAARRQLAALASAVGGTIRIAEAPDVAIAGNQLQEVFIALIGNALTHRAPDRAPVVDVSASSADDGWVVITVADNGPGVPEPHRERVFRLFEQLSTHSHNSEGRLGQGNGIGLPLARRVVEAAGGRIWIEPSALGGAAVRFTAPTASDKSLMFRKA